MDSPSTETLIQEVIYHGSLFEAFHSKYLEPSAVLLYLTTVPKDQKTEIAYKALSHFLHVNRQYLPEKQNYHFLYLKPEYRYMFKYLGGNLDLPVRKWPAKKRRERRKTSSLKDSLTFSIPELTSEKLLCGVCPPRKPGDYSSHIRGRNISDHLYPGKPQQHLSYLLEQDWFDELLKLDKLILAPRSSFVLVLKRCTTLQEKAPHYWNTIGKLGYTLVWKLILGNIKHNVLRQEDLFALEELIPGLVDKHSLRWGNLAYRITQQTIPVGCYLLGFPLHLYEIPVQLFEHALDKLSQLGPQEYLEIIKRFNQNTYHVVPNPFDDEVKSAVNNENNVLLEECLSFSPLDIVGWYDGKQWFLYTREEFPSLLKDGKDPYSRRGLPSCVTTEMERRLKLAERYKLPECCSLEEWYRKGPPEKKEPGEKVLDPPIVPFTNHEAAPRHTYQTNSGYMHFNHNDAPRNVFQSSPGQASLSAYFNHNAAPRNVFQTSMSRHTLERETPPEVTTSFDPETTLRDIYMETPIAHTYQETPSELKTPQVIFPGQTYVGRVHPSSEEKKEAPEDLLEPQIISPEGLTPDVRTQIFDSTLRLQDRINEDLTAHGRSPITLHIERRKAPPHQNVWGPGMWHILHQTRGDHLPPLHLDDKFSPQGAALSDYSPPSYISKMLGGINNRRVPPSVLSQIDEALAHGPAFSGGMYTPRAGQKGTIFNPKERLEKALFSDRDGLMTSQRKITYKECRDYVRRRREGTHRVPRFLTPVYEKVMFPDRLGARKRYQKYELDNIAR